jgi:hypothetical protein
MDKLVELRDQIGERMEAGATLEQTESMIDSSGLSDDAHNDARPSSATCAEAEPPHP